MELENICTRRTFIGGGVAGVAALACGGCRTVARFSDGKVRLAAVGVWGKGFTDWLPMVQSGKACLVAVCDCDRSMLAKAAEELKKYLRMMMPEAGNFNICFNSEANDGIRLGLMQDLGLDVSDVEDTKLDDIIYIDMQEKEGIIAGDNPRAVLLAVYDYLRENGCRWLLPGIDGEYIPMRDSIPFPQADTAAGYQRVLYSNSPSARQLTLLRSLGSTSL